MRWLSSLEALRETLDLPICVKRRQLFAPRWAITSQPFYTKAKREKNMPMPRKPDPLKHCEHCGTRLVRKRSVSGVLESLLHFNRRKFCNQHCMAQAFDQRHSPEVGWSTAHYHARKEVPPGSCNRCGKLDAIDVHHKDGNHLNNSRENLERICRSCHNREHRPRGSCVICGRLQKGLGYCEKHYQRFKKWGDPLIVKDNQHTECRFAD